MPLKLTNSIERAISKVGAYRAAASCNKLTGQHALDAMCALEDAYALAEGDPAATFVVKCIAASMSEDLEESWP